MTDLTESADRLFAMHCSQAITLAAECGTWPAALWTAVEEAGFTAAMVSEEAGGFGTTIAEAMAVLRVASAQAVPIPLAETMLGARLLSRAGLPVPPGPLTVAPVRKGDRLTAQPAGQLWRITGIARRVPWGRLATAVVLADGPDGPIVAALPAGQCKQGANLAGEPRDTVTWDVEVAGAVAPLDAASLRLAGAALRTNQIAGALAGALAITTDYVKTRVQFGHPIGKFQAVQHAMAAFAGEAAAAIAAADMAAEALSDLDSVLLVAAAKARAGEAASIAAGLAHQAHGAIGFTREYRLHHLTRRLWSWRDEFGNESEWNVVAGRHVAAAGPEGLWPLIAAA